MDEFTACRLPHCAFVGRTCKWIQYAGMPGGPIACPRCGGTYRRDQSTLAPAGRGITSYNK
eukprot:7355440-Alexandrium_andersonii.AAC.1